MAAGEGRRLRPLTERFAKPVLPIDGRPVIATLLRELAAAGIERVIVVTGHLGGQVEALVGDGSAFGLEAAFVRQPRPDGSADAVRRASASAPFLVAAADTVFGPGDLSRFRAAAEGADGAIAVRRDPPPGPGRAPVRVEEGLVTRMSDDDPENPLAGAPLWALGPELVRYLDGLPGPPYELSAAFRRAVDDGRRVAGVEIGRTRDLTYPVDLILQNFPYLAREA